MKLEVWHNILWSRYKAEVFSELARIAPTHAIDLTVFQIAETDSDRVSLAEVDLSLHRYPMVNLFKGAFSDVPRLNLALELVRRTTASQADVTILAGFERPEYWLQALLLLLRRRRRAVFCDSTLFDNRQSTFKTFIKRLVFAICKDAFCYGERSREYLLHHGVSPDHIHIRRQAAALPNGYDPTEVPGLRQAHAAVPPAPVFLYVGRFSPEKRIDTLIRAFALVLEEYPAATLRLVGGGREDGQLKALASELGIRERIDFAGSKSGQALYGYYLEATCLVLPSWSEPWGLVVNEALHFGCPVVVSHRCGCVPEIVEASDCGMVFTCDDIDDLSRKLSSASATYTDIEVVAKACLHKISGFTPEIAAQGIIDGVIAMTKPKSDARDGK